MGFLKQISPLIGQVPTYIMFMILWFIVPLIFMSFSLVTRAILKEVIDQEQYIAAHAGKYAGYLFFIIYVLLSYSALTVPDPFFDVNIQFDLLNALLGIFLGVGLLVFLKKFLKTKLIGVFTLIFTFCSMSSTYNYFFIRTNNGLFLSLIVGFIVGVMLYLVVCPQDFKKIWFTERSIRR